MAQQTSNKRFLDANRNPDKLREFEWFVRLVGFASLSLADQVFSRELLPSRLHWRSFKFSHPPRWTLSPDKRCLTSSSLLLCVANRVAAARVGIVEENLVKPVDRFAHDNRQSSRGHSSCFAAKLPATCNWRWTMDFYHRSSFAHDKGLCNWNDEINYDRDGFV